MHTIVKTNEMLFAHDSKVVFFGETAGGLVEKSGLFVASAENDAHTRS